MATRIYRTSTAGSTTTWTWSGWIKRAKVSSGNQTLFAGVTDGNNWTEAYFKSDDLLYIENNDSSSITGRLITSRKFRDLGAWMHIVVVWDTTNGTPGDRMRLYVNGVEETAFGTDTNPGSSQASILNEASSVTSVGGHSLAAEDFYGEMSHIHFTDGYAYDASAFGETDATSGIWKIKISPSVTYGTNGFFMKMEDRTNLDLDSSSNAFTMTTSGTLTATEDNPSNNFCTFNRLDRWLDTTNNYGDYLTKGNNTVTIGTSNKGLIRGTLGVESGKWYWEAQANSVSKGFYGMINYLAFTTSTAPHNSTNKAGIYYYEGVPDFRYYSGAGEIATDAVSITAGDILIFALDMDNKAFYIGKNGTWMASGDPTSGSSKTGAISEKFANPTAWTDSGPVFPATYVSSTTGSIDADYNFGNGYFGTTAISSEGTNASGIGKFEYDVPTGYTALSTKGLNE